MRDTDQFRNICAFVPSGCIMHMKSKLSEVTMFRPTQEPNFGLHGDEALTAQMSAVPPAFETYVAVADAEMHPKAPSASAPETAQRLAGDAAAILELAGIKPARTEQPQLPTDDMPSPQKPSVPGVSEAGIFSKTSNRYNPETGRVEPSVGRKGTGGPRVVGPAPNSHRNTTPAERARMRREVNRRNQEAGDS
jgi:hypothetical protein